MYPISTAHFIPACFLIGLIFVGNRPYVCVTFISLALGFCGGISITSLQNPHDLSPNFATTIFGFMHTVGQTPGYVFTVAYINSSIYLTLLLTYFQIYSTLDYCSFDQEKGI